MSQLKSTRVAITSLWRGQLSEYITSIAWSKDGEALVASSAGGEVVYWHGQQLISLLEPTGTTIDSLSFDASDRYLVAAGQTGDLRVWDCHNHQPELLLSLPHKSIWIDTLKWHSDRPYLAFAIGRFVQIWDIATRELITTLDFDLSTVFDLAWHPAGTHLAVSGNMGARIWDCADWDAEPEFMPANSTIKHLVWSPDGDFLAGATLDRHLLISSIDELASSWAMSGFPARIGQLEWLFTVEPTIAAISADSLVLWVKDREKWRAIELNSRQDLITAMSIHPTRSWIATTSVDGSISIADPKLGVIGSLDPIDLDFTQIAWHPHRQILATGSQQGEVTIWVCEGE
jgi:WD40 repeat protein